MSGRRTAGTTRTRLLVVLGVLGIAVVVAAISLAAPPLGAPTLTATPPSPSASTSASFSFTGPSGRRSSADSTPPRSVRARAPRPISDSHSQRLSAFGSHQFRVHANLAQDQLRTYTSSIVVPSASIGSGPANPTNATSASFAVHVERGECDFECKLDAGSFAACTTPKRVRGSRAPGRTRSRCALSAHRDRAPERVRGLVPVDDRH